jgi:hypothetical protein
VRTYSFTAYRMSVYSIARGAIGTTELRAEAGTCVILLVVASTLDSLRFRLHFAGLYYSAQDP